MPNDTRSADFELDPAVYDAMVDWQRRLANEAPFWRARIDEAAARRALDVACGPGRHAAMFREWGLDVTGVDASAAMIAHCQRERGEYANLRWRQCAFAELGQLADEPPFDLVYCIGNSLALAGEISHAAAAIRDMGRLLRPGGVCVVQVLNFHRLVEGPVHWSQPREVCVGGALRTIVKGVHRVGSAGYIDVVEFEAAGGLDTTTGRSTRLLALTPADLQPVFSSGDWRDAMWFGGYDEQPFDSTSSVDLMLIARRA